MVLRVLVAILLSLLSTVVMSYIALAASIGPWIETTLVLISMILFKVIAHRNAKADYIHAVSLTTAAGGIGGILATGLAFSLPTFYFLSPHVFQSWLENPLFFAQFVGCFCFVSGGFGLIMASLFEDRLLNQQQLKFPIGDLIYNALAAPGHMRKALELTAGFIGTQVLLALYYVSSYAGRALIALQGSSWSLITIPTITIPVDQLPMYVAVGFVTGHVIAWPLIVGFLAKILCLDPLFYIYTHNSSSIHSFLFASFANTQLTSTEFILAFCSGMVLYGSCRGFMDLFKGIMSVCKKMCTWLKSSTLTTYALFQTALVIVITCICLRSYQFTLTQQILLVAASGMCLYALALIATHTGFVTTWGIFPVVRMVRFQEFVVRTVQALRHLMVSNKTPTLPWFQSVIVMLPLCGFLYYCKFTLLQQIYLIVFTAVCIYQMLIIAGRMGIIPLGRFATFVMIPGMFLFNFDYLQVTLVAAFVEIAGGVAGDVLFGRKLAALASVKHEKIVGYQWLGLLICSLSIGIFFWLFITTLGIGSEHGLPATKAASRALLIAFKSFDWYVLGFGFIFGYLIQFIRINPALLLGGILMPPSISLMLICGGLLTYCTQNKERYYPLMSGISAGNSLWMLGETMLKFLV